MNFTKSETAGDKSILEHIATKICYGIAIQSFPIVSKNPYNYIANRFKNLKQIPNYKTKRNSI